MQFYKAWHAAGWYTCIPMPALAVADNSFPTAVMCHCRIQEVCAAEDPAKVSELAALLQKNIRMSKDRYYTTQLGNKAAGVLGPATEVFPLVRTGA